jgi:hypothetical protein
MSSEYMEVFHELNPLLTDLTCKNEVKGGPLLCFMRTDPGQALNKICGPKCPNFNKF